MRCLSPEECQASFLSLPLKFNEQGLGHFSGKCARVEARPSGDIVNLGSYLDEIFRWLPPNASRAFSFYDWGFGALSQPCSAVAAIRQASGETRALLDAPVHYFSPMSWTWDIEQQTDEDRKEVGLLSGLMISAMCYGWSGWLVAEGRPDAIELWEGNILFYSPDESRLSEAREMLRGIGFPPEMK